MQSRNKEVLLFILLFILLMLQACAGRRPPAGSPFGIKLISNALKDQLDDVSESVAAVQAVITYKVYKFNYATADGKFVRDPDSEMKYRLQSADGTPAVVVEEDEKTLSGGGLIIRHDLQRRKYTILTSSHLVAPQDTTDVYYFDEKGLQTDAVFARYIIQDVKRMVRVDNNWRVEANLITNDVAHDLAIIEIQTRSNVGVPLSRSIGYEMDLGWGDWVFIFGYPRGVKQLTGGWVSKGPYRTTMAVDAVVRSGFSGGPVFAISEEKQELVFVGLVKSVPRSTRDYIAVDRPVPPGYSIGAEDLDKLVVRSEMMIDYGTAYFVNPPTVRRFFEAKREEIEDAGVVLPSKYYGR